MPTVEQRAEQLQGVKEKLKELVVLDPKALARTTDLSPDINFKAAVPHFEEMLDVCKQLSERDLSRLTHRQLSTMSSAFDQLSSLINQVKEFTLNQNTPGDVCNDIVASIADAYDGVMDPLLLPLAFTATQATDYAKIEREAKGYHATMQKETEELSSFISSARTEAERALAAVKEQAAEAGVSTNAQIFVGVAKQHEAASGKWLKATVRLTVVTLVVALAALIAAFLYQPTNVAATIQYVVAKLLVISTLSFGVLWCARNYRSERHNETLNRHRANALMTFRAFVEGSGDDRIKDAILLQAAQAAFSGRPTGFDSPERESPTINPVVEILGKSLSRSGE